ncbi:hypothetical protein KC19_11G059600 [Ceratodon purpureus]|nr:hypothetical protein KC19_11G059600 [Ceratodon purpureus]KAG0556519.1 hypothetical protein KC19_11G059600 [Ceratodon purpureus]KAG0556520.1 hypothetical protein KC19_11G059600 [Ceratodon purpureus]KAG0556522.1 hypothetical protein KC19_11G059600 [Ceratodon purpureus]
MATGTASREHNGYIALLLLCVVLTTFSHSAMAQCSAAESAALLKFKSVLVDTSGDLATWGPAGANCCSWRGIKCSATGVEAIDLASTAPALNSAVELDPQNAEASSNIAGDALAALPQLSSIRTDGITWPGPVPLRQLSKVPLRELVIRNAPGGHLPSDIGTFGGTLERLVVTGTNYKTGLPSSVCKLTKLKFLEVSSTGMPSLGPSCLGKITSLEEVRMQNNHKVTGGLPVWLTSLPNLKVLDLSNNAHSGNIPVQYGKLANVDLHLGGNHLASRIPAGLSGKPEATFRPGNEKLCGAPLGECPV